MKTLSVFIIMASLSFKLNAFDFNSNSNNSKEFLELINKARTEEDKAKKDPKSNPYYRLLREDEIRNDQTCTHCPKYLLLTEAVNKVVEKMAQDPKAPDELPTKITKLKFMFYTQALRERDGTISCKRFMDYTPDLRPTKFDGQFKLMAEDVLKFNAVTEIHYMNPDAEETVYYYRGEGEEKNTILQAILTKNGGKFRYYRYTPSEQEENPYNLPGMRESTPPKNEVLPASNFVAKDAKDILPQSEGGGSVTGLKAKEGYQVKFKTEVEKRNKIIPNNVHFVEAQVDQDLIGEFNVKGTSDVSLSGNEARFAIKKEGTDLVLIDLNTRLNGKTEHKVVVPFSMRVFDELPGVKGRVESNSNEQILNLSLVDKGIDLVRSEFRHNASTGATSYVLARDATLAKNEVISMQYGKSEDNKQYASIKHVKSIKDNVTLVLDVKVDQDRKATLFYQVNAKF